MQKKHYSISINAPREKVWTTLWGADTYPKWTEAFSPTSHAVTDWQQGSKVLFLDGDNNGMVGRIEQNRPNEHMSIAMLGEVLKGVEDTTSDRVKAWAGGHENYTLRAVDGKTELLIDTDVAEEFMEMFDGMWPKSLAKVKELAEG